MQLVNVSEYPSNLNMEIYCTIPEKKFVFIEFLPV